MSAFIKSPTSAAAIVWPDKEALPQPPRVDPLIAALEAEITRLQGELETEALAAHKAIEDGRNAAKAEALAQFKRDETQSLQKLEHALVSARADVRAALVDVERLSLRLAQSALETVLGSGSDYSNLIERTIAHEISALDRQTIVSIEVSQADFPSREALDALAQRLASVHIEASSRLDAGACRLVLTLGDIEISLPEHWANLRALFHRLEQGERS